MNEQGDSSPVRRLRMGMRAFSSEGAEVGRVASVGGPSGRLQVVDEAGRSLWIERAQITAIGGEHVVMRW